ncbi:MAG: NAD(P)-dependent oxidoreductase [Capsulimonas sp.]|uniref:NAD(P)-dependent oxidoreductase n=1 Tax=Capsulimonas sp. TaxID=2494211 RepID=UPI003265CDFF
MSIYFFETDAQQQRYLTERLPNETLNFNTEPLKTAAQAREIADAEIVSPFVHSHIGADVIDALPNLKMIATRSTGFDHINTPSAESRGIPVSNVPTYGENTVAEHTFALILALSRNLHKAYVQTSAGNFSRVGLQGFDLLGKTLGIVGVGGVGRFVAQIARGFGMNVIAYDPAEDMEKAARFGYTYTTLDDLIARSDVVSLHAPLTGSNRHLIGSHNLTKFKRGAFLINTSRGELVDTQALLCALDDGILRGAGLDVIEGEEVYNEERQLLLNPAATAGSLKTALTNLSLLRRPDLIITPHIAYDSQEAIERLMNTTIANIQAFRAGSPQNIVHT